MLTISLISLLTFAATQTSEQVTAAQQMPRPSTTSTQDDPPALPPEVARRSEMKTVDGPAQYFTGKATITGQFSRPLPSRITGAIVRFEPGARTAWHKHPLGQTLIVTEGKGWTQIEGGVRQEFGAGDILWCPPGKRHWHGATPDGSMTHVAVQEALEGANVVWMEKVSDAQYLGK